jgi:hypothetical protein
MMLTVQSVQADVADPYDRTCGDMADSGWQTLDESCVRHVAVFWSMIGCHVAQSWAATWHPGIG